MEYKSKFKGAEVDALLGKVENNEVGGADWNAQKGEAGYIKNKPFKFYNEDVEFSIPNNFLKAEDFTSYTDWDNNITTYTSKNNFSSGIADIFYMGRTDINLDYVLNGSFFIRPKHVSNGYVIPGIFGDIFLTDRYDEDAGITRLIITASSDEDVFAYKIYVDESFSLFVETLPEVYLPKTVLKTTPQTLSDDAKNQALANLGIDPVVWKYMCNPLILGDYLLEIPLELRDIILGDYSEEFGYTLKPIASSLIKIYNGAGFTSIATFGNGQDYNIDFENNNFIINNHYEIEFV